MELPAGDLEKLSKLAEHRSATGLREDLERIPEFAAKPRPAPGASSSTGWRRLPASPGTSPSTWGG
jgi:hypothetical protein